MLGRFIKIIQNIIIMTVFVSISSCANFNTNNIKIDFPYTIDSNTKNKSFIFNVDKNNNKGISFSINLNFNDFLLKSSTSGNLKKIKSDISLLRVYLVDNNSSTLNASNIKSGPFDLTSNTPTGTLLTFFNNVKDTNGNGTLTFINVGAGTYYVAIAAYDSSSSLDYTKNIVDTSNNISGAYTNITVNDTNLGRFALSTTGGDYDLGKIEVERTILTDGSIDYKLVHNGTTSLNINLALKSGFGAIIDSNLTITNGNNTIPEINLE
ncbi:MAG: hypothetical protein AABZ74_02595 [Cyanobacteriota bacterium]